MWVCVCVHPTNLMSYHMLTNRAVAMILQYPSPPPACQCNGHSVCVNESVCAECQNNTKGEQCQDCAEHYFGDATGGGTCTGERFII